MLGFRLCVLGKGSHRSGVGSLLRTLMTWIPWWRRRLPSFSIVTAPCFFPPLKLTSKPKFSRKKSKFGQVYSASTLERAAGLHASALACFTAGVWKREFWLWALQHRAALCPSSSGQRIQCMNACHGLGMPELFTGLWIAPWRQAFASASQGWLMPAEVLPCMGQSKCVWNILLRLVVSIPFKNLCYFPPRTWDLALMEKPPSSGAEDRKGLRMKSFSRDRAWWSTRCPSLEISCWVLTRPLARRL